MFRLAGNIEKLFINSNIIWMQNHRFFIKNRKLTEMNFRYNITNTHEVTL